MSKKKKNKIGSNLGPDGKPFGDDVGIPVVGTVKPVSETPSKPIYRFGWLGYMLAKVCIQFTRWLADKVFGAFANWVEKKLKK